MPASPSRRAMPITPADQMGACVDCLPIRAAFPVIQPGRHPRFHFRGPLRLHSIYGPSGCSTAQGGLCHEASIRSVTQPNRSSATRPIDNYLGGTFLHWRYAPSGRTERRKLPARHQQEGTAAIGSGAKPKHQNTKRRRPHHHEINRRRSTKINRGLKVLFS